MVRATEAKELAPDVYLKTFYGLSTDSKPTEHLANGSCFIEINTGDVYFFDEANIVWLKVGGSSDS